MRLPEAIGGDTPLFGIPGIPGLPYLDEGLGISNWVFHDFVRRAAISSNICFSIMT
jgi:hypothetical protein